MDPDELVKATGEEHNTIPDAVKAKLQAIEQGELEKGAFDKGDIVETVCDQIASGAYREAELGEESVKYFQALIQGLSENFEGSG